MDRMTPSHNVEPSERRPLDRPQTSRRIRTAALVLLALGAGIWLGLRAGQGDLSLPGGIALPSWLVSVPGNNGSSPAANGSIAYYRDPDGKPFYSAEPTRTEDGRDYVAVRASEDVSFEDKPKDTPTAPSAANQEGGKRLLYYRNPMGLPDTSPTPKKDSMGMDYLPVYEGEAEDGSTVTVSPGRLQRTGVRSEPAERRVVTRPVRAPGTLKLDERRVAVISLRTEGFIEKVENVTTGERVRAGQPLLRLYSPEISAASAQYLSVLNDGSGAAGRAAVLEGARRRLENLDVPPEALTEIERGRKVPTTITWSAPRDGLVLERNATDGMRAMPGDVLFRIADLSILWVLADVPEHDLGAVRLGQAVTIRVRSLPGQTFSGKISLIYPQVNLQTRTARVRIEIPNPDGLLLPDMYADVEIASGAANPVVAVPDSALIDTGTRQVVIVDKGEGRFEPRQVRVGASGNGYVEIREGVAAGDRVVVSANFLIDAESNLKAALHSMTAPTEEKVQ
ncbi:efflux RND transporter periplasmic adaptor subunit [Microvirga sp. ACRRW]|uniref:efflux RND transporter periplasmic adaptor subunit n=1 Tax=Microvirga sp. ACRRW TaxID=2918205 RepID=UPI00351D0571